MTRKLKDIIGIEEEDSREIEADGEDLPEEKLNETNEKMMEFEETIAKLESYVNDLHMAEELKGDGSDGVEYEPDQKPDSEGSPREQQPDSSAPESQNDMNLSTIQL